MISISNYGIALQCVKPVHSAYCGLHNSAENCSWALDVNGRDRDVCFPTSRRDGNVDNFLSRGHQDETLVRLESRDRLETDTSRPRPQPWMYTFVGSLVRFGQMWIPCSPMPSHAVISHIALCRPTLQDRSVTTINYQWEIAYGFSIGTKLGDLEWPWTA